MCLGFWFYSFLAGAAKSSFLFATIPSVGKQGTIPTNGSGNPLFYFVVFGTWVFGQFSKLLVVQVVPLLQRLQGLPLL